MAIRIFCKHHNSGMKDSKDKPSRGGLNPQASLRRVMISREQRDLIYESCAAIYDDPEDANIIAEATVIRIEERMISFPEFVKGILKRDGLSRKMRKRLQDMLQQRADNGALPALFPERERKSRNEHLRWQSILPNDRK